ncbi:MAG: 3-deoxy-D-manno-octulosonic acid transferase [Planctomycetia bacterium]
MAPLLNVVYLAALLALLPWAAWRRLSGRRPVAALWTRFTGSVRHPPAASGAATRRIWMHGVSVGEVQLVATLAAEVAARAAAAGLSVDCVASSSTTTGLKVAERRFGPDRVFPGPLDFSWAVARTLDRVRPDLLVLGELELWPNLLAAAGRRGIPVVVVNARMSERSAAGYRRITWLVRRMLGQVSLVVARSAADGNRFTAAGAANVVVAGSMKFDGVRGDRNTPEIARLRRMAGIHADDVVFLAGSTQDPEERLAAEAFVAACGRHPAVRLVLVPRHVERTPEIAALLDGLGLRWQPRSRLEADGPDPQCRVLLVDTTGELAAWWGTATIAFVGGSLDGRRGGQNMLEPAAYGAAVACGPHTGNFHDEVAVLRTADAVEVVADGAALTAFVARCLAEPAWAAERGRRAAAAVAAGRGATPLTARLLLEQLGKTGKNPCMDGGSCRVGPGPR